MFMHILCIYKKNILISLFKIDIKIKIRAKFSGKTDNFDFLGSNLHKNGFWGGDFKNLTPDLKSATLRYHMCQISVKMDNFEFFGLNLGKLPNFGPNNIERAGWRLK